MAASQVNQTPTNTQGPGSSRWQQALAALAVALVTGLVPALLSDHPAPVTNNNTSCYSCQVTNGSSFGDSRR
jgi:hypothetical protein